MREGHVHLLWMTVDIVDHDADDLALRGLTGDTKPLHQVRQSVKNSHALPLLKPIHIRARRLSSQESPTPWHDGVGGVWISFRQFHLSKRQRETGDDDEGSHLSPSLSSKKASRFCGTRLRNTEAAGEVFAASSATTSRSLIQHRSGPPLAMRLRTNHHERKDIYRA
jgi:hypothetical protein